MNDKESSTDTDLRTIHTRERDRLCSTHLDAVTLTSKRARQAKPRQSKASLIQRTRARARTQVNTYILDRDTGLPTHLAAPTRNSHASDERGVPHEATAPILSSSQVQVLPKPKDGAKREYVNMVEAPVVHQGRQQASHSGAV